MRRKPAPPTGFSNQCGPIPCPKSLLRLARAASASANRNRKANEKWVAAFREVYGHDDISDALVELIDYGAAPQMITAEFIAQNSAPGES